MFKLIIALTLLIPYLIPPATSAAFKLPDTGQTKCYQAVSPYSETSCGNTGQDGEYIINPLSYSESNGTITDNNSGLMWQKIDNGILSNWPTSSNYCENLNLGDYTDWRLPTLKELMTIVHYGMTYPSPTIDAVFPDTGLRYYWSSTAGVASSGQDYWCASFELGRVETINPTSKWRVRCVRGEQIPQSLTDNGNGTVNDLRTGLVWQQAETSAMIWSDALSYCNNLDLGEKTDWRLPNVKELESLTDLTRNHPAINVTYFPNTRPETDSFYWTSTTMDYLPRTAWFVHFEEGIVGYEFAGNKSSSYYVRCVRGGETERVWIVGTTNYFNTLQGAHDAADNGTSIEAMASIFPENFTVSKELTLNGGYDSGFISSNGYTTIQGTLMIQAGSLAAANLVVR